MHWSEKYIGRPYARGVYECPHLVEEVLRREFGVEVVLPKVDWRNTPPADLEAICLDIARPAASPLDGRGVLMRIQGNKRSLGSHVGVCGLVSGQPWVLHTMKHSGAIFVPLGQLHLCALEPVGFYEWISR